jgi:hypothetical protein
MEYRPKKQRIGFLNALICAAWIRSGTDDRVYLSLRKSMTIKAYIHTASKRAEVESLLDSGATENFISEDLAYRMRTPIVRDSINQDLYLTSMEPRIEKEISRGIQTYKSRQGLNTGQCDSSSRIWEINN